jgi:chromosome segregation protein
MYLTSIEISGFKSFAKKSELVFTSSISSIVGPNGSGKSNIAEAFRFVLGEQSMKSMRGKKGEDMVWNGSAEVPKAGKASVKVVFDNSTRFLPIDFSQVTLERVVHRDSVNEYFINGSQVRLKDVIELLAGAHIGASGHHIISQGEADRVLNATTRERKAMIEEALGLKIYQYKKIESIKKLEKTQENIAQVESLRREIAPHIKFLKKQVEKVEKAVELRNELLVLSTEYLKREDDFLKKTQDTITQQKVPLEEDRDRIEREIIQSKDILRSAETKDQKSDELISLEEKIHTIRVAKDGLVREIGRIEGETVGQTRIIHKQQDLARSNEWKTVQLRAVEDLHMQVHTLITEIENSHDTEKNKISIGSIKDLLRAFVEMHKDAVDTTLISEAQREIERLSAERVVVEEKIKQNTEEEKRLDVLYTQLKQSIEKEKDTNRETEKMLFRLMSDEQTVGSHLKSIEREEHILAHLQEDFKREMTELGMLLGREVLAFGEKNFDGGEAREVQEERKRKIEKIKIRLEDSGGIGRGETIKEYDEAFERDQFLEKELTDLRRSSDSLTQLIGELEAKIKTEFSLGVEKINKQFGQYFALMFGGGEAKLSVIAETKRKRKSDMDTVFDLDSGEESLDEEEPTTEEGVDIEVSLPRKKVKGLMMLSGGERALTSIALLFAVSQVNPPPFIILDETDAALDEANSRKYGDMIVNLSAYSQLIVITHNRETMSRAGVLYGVTMGSGGVSKLLSVSFEDAVAVAK